MALVAAGIGIAIVPEGVAKGHGDVAIREIDVKVKREVGLAYRASVPLADPLKDFIGKLRRGGTKQRPSKRTTSSRRRNSQNYPSRPFRPA